jgi:hypothetical protein
LKNDSADDCFLSVSFATHIGKSQDFLDKEKMYSVYLISGWKKQQPIGGTVQMLPTVGSLREARSTPSPLSHPATGL